MIFEKRSISKGGKYYAREQRMRMWIRFW